MLERGIEENHTTLFLWAQQYAPKIEKRLRWYYKSGLGENQKVDETYVKVKGKWKYLYRTIAKSGKTLDFYLSSTRNAKAAKRLPGKALRKMKEYEKPVTINTDLAQVMIERLGSSRKKGFGGRRFFIGKSNISITELKRIMAN